MHQCFWRRWACRDLELGVYRVCFQHAMLCGQVHNEECWVWARVRLLGGGEGVDDRQCVCVCGGGECACTDLGGNKVQHDPLIFFGMRRIILFCLTYLGSTGRTKCSTHQNLTKTIIPQTNCGSPQMGSCLLYSREELWTCLYRELNWKVPFTDKNLNVLHSRIKYKTNKKANKTS